MRDAAISPENQDWTKVDRLPKITDNQLKF